MSESRVVITKVTEAGLREARARLDAALDGMIAAIEAADTPEDAWAAVESLQKDLEKPWRTRVKELREQVVLRLYNERRMSLRALARNTKLSPGRIGQLTANAKESRDAT